MIEEFAVTSNMVKQHMKRGEKLFFVHVRHHTDWDTGLLQAHNSIRVPDDELEKHLDEIPADCTVIVYSGCPGDTPGIEAARVLQRHGHKDVHPLIGGFSSYLKEGLPVREIDPDRSVMRKLMLL